MELPHSGLVTWFAAVLGNERDLDLHSREKPVFPQALFGPVSFLETRFLHNRFSGLFVEVSVVMIEVLAISVGWVTAVAMAAVLIASQLASIQIPRHMDFRV
jgi:hypothetical protein